MASNELRTPGKNASEDLWRRTISQIPSVFGRLVYLGGRRNSNTGLYEHHGLAATFNEHLADLAIRESHLNAFREWLNFDIEQQRADLELYLTEQPTTRRTMLENWLRLSPYRNAMPITASPADRELFLEEFEVLLQILLNESRR